MKETLNISLKGISFTIDKNGYDILKEYFDELQRACAIEGEEGREIADDIEARAAELFLSMLKDKDSVIDKDMAQKVIDQLGGIDQIQFIATPDADNADNSETTENANVSEKQNPQQDSDIPHRLYRTKEGARLGGVISGMARYFKVDAGLVRLMFAVFIMLLFILSNYVEVLSTIALIICAVYILAWITIPRARSPRQIIELDGRQVSPRSVSKILKEKRNAPQQNPKNEKTLSVISDILWVIGKIITTIFVICMTIVCIGLGVGALSILVGGIFLAIKGQEAIAICTASNPTLLISVATLSMVIPLISIVYFLARTINSKPIRPSVTIPLVALWVMSWSAFAFLGFVEGKRYGTREHKEIAVEVNSLKGNTLFIKPTDRKYGNYKLASTDIEIAESSDSLLHVVKVLYARGESRAEASEIIDSIDVNVYQKGDTLFVDRDQDFITPSSFRGQRVKVKVYYPAWMNINKDKRFDYNRSFINFDSSDDILRIRTANKNSTKPTPKEVNININAKFDNTDNTGNIDTTDSGNTSTEEGYKREEIII